ncbi:Fic family protein [Saccharothrix sp. S26]|uniref:Fic family protein n=1 Tax=Saccharothrix sp. S26 TaxID=2907215 RepID=UPI001F443485|nr:Fic family protein [Saccharothrix sp. S26]MCE6993555.1 Fic family protein [Saccharothrix sp. S26]
MSSVVDLQGCPYSLPDDSDIDKQIDVLFDAERRVREKVQAASREIQAKGFLIDYAVNRQTREIYESNKLEDLGPSLARTSEILKSPDAALVDKDLMKGMLYVGMKRDKHLIDVLGLHGAKVLAESYVSTLADGRPLSESDIRSMHALITSGEEFAGRYKRYHVRIGGEGTHEPPLPIDTPAEMRDFSTWLSRDHGGMPVTLHAAIAHAWLTHIHPFEDGNGRLARVLVNLIFARNGLPPAIIKHNTERTEYIDALAHSDVAGDIFPLAGIFIKAEKRFARDMGKPGFVRSLIGDEINGRSRNIYSSWLAVFNNFMARLFGELRVRNLTVEDFYRLDEDSFWKLTKADKSGNMWFFLVGNGVSDLLVWIGFCSLNLHDPRENVVRYPSLFFAVRNKNYRLQRWTAAPSNRTGGLIEVCVVPGVKPSVQVRLDDRIRKGGIVDGASEIADRIYSGLRSAVVS